MEFLRDLLKWLKRERINLAIKKYSDKYNIPQNLIEAIIEVESGYDTDAIRFEKNFRWFEEPFSDYHFHKETEQASQQISWGLMQIMGSVARQHGFKGNYLTELLKPEVGIKYGCKHLQSYYKRYDNWEDAISSYNQGSPRKDNDGNYKNQRYVDKVLSLMKNKTKEW